MMLTNSLKKIKGTQRRIYWKEILACLLLIIGIYFFRQQRRVLTDIFVYLHQADRRWLLAAAAVSGLFILLQAAMYVSSFAAIRSRLKWGYAIELFLKRHL